MPNAIRAAYSDLKTVKTRSVCQLIFEIPIEQMADAFQLLGAPVPGNEVWVGIARLRPQQIEAPREPAKLSQLAGIMSNEHMFQKWLMVSSTDEAAAKIRERCHVKSRSELDADPEAARLFRIMRSDYDFWLNA